MIEREIHESSQELDLAERTAKKLARALNRPVGLGEDLSFTVGNVTFGWEHVRDASTFLGLADLIDYFDEIDSGHYGIASTSADETGWRRQSNGPIEKPQTFLAMVKPRSTVREIARQAFLGRNH